MFWNHVPSHVLLDWLRIDRLEEVRTNPGILHFPFSNEKLRQFFIALHEPSLEVQ